MVRRFRPLLLILLLLIPGQARAVQKEGRITAKAWALVEATSGRLLLGENERDRRPMASTTKIMTALLVLEAGEDLDALITVPPEAAGTEGSSMHLNAGEKLSLRDLLYGRLCGADERQGGSPGLRRHPLHEPPRPPRSQPLHQRL